jgi:hypothetical protein
MASRFRKELTTVPVVRIRMDRHGLSTTIRSRGTVQASVSSSVGNAGSGRSLRQIGDPRLSGPLPTDPFLIPGTRTDFGGGNVAEMTSPGLSSFKELLVATRRREQEITTDIRKAEWQLRLARAAQSLGWLSLISVAAKPIRRRASQAVAVRRSEVTTLSGNLAATKISVNFDMDSEIAEPHRRMQAAFDRMGSSQKAWSVPTTQRIDRVKARSWAGIVVLRMPALLRRAAVYLVDTEDLPLAMNVMGGKSTAYFYPGFVLIGGGHGSDFALIDITELGIISAHTSFTESESVPSDATMVGKTWAKANKNGSRDRRFAHNRELPIMRYGSLHLVSAGGMNEAFMFSNAQASDDFARSAEELKRILASGPKVRKSDRSRLQLDSPAPHVGSAARQCPRCAANLRLPTGRSGIVRCPECRTRFNTAT